MRINCAGTLRSGLVGELAPHRCRLVLALLRGAIEGVTLTGCVWCSCRSHQATVVRWRGRLLTTPSLRRLRLTFKPSAHLDLQRSRAVLPHDPCRRRLREAVRGTMQACGGQLRRSALGTVAAMESLDAVPPSRCLAQLQGRNPSHGRWVLWLPQCRTADLVCQHAVGYRLCQPHFALRLIGSWRQPGGMPARGVNTIFPFEDKDGPPSTSTQRREEGERDLAVVMSTTSW